jgi:hypothetical protein
MNSDGTELFCTACGKRWDMDELSDLHATSGETEFTHIRTGNEWQRANVRREVETGTYSITCPVGVESLPQCARIHPHRSGTLTHDIGWIRRSRLRATMVRLRWSSPSHSLYRVTSNTTSSAKMETCVDLNTLDDTWYCVIRATAIVRSQRWRCDG